MLTTAHFQVIHIASALTSSRDTSGWKRRPPLAGRRLMLCWIRNPVKLRTLLSSIWTGKWQVNSRWTSRRIFRRPGSSLRIAAASSNWCWAVRQGFDSVRFCWATAMAATTLHEHGGRRVLGGRVAYDVKTGRHTGLGCAFKSRRDLLRPLDQLAIPAERLDDLVVAGARPQVGGDRGPQHLEHGVLLSGPDPVVADYADDRHPVPDQAVELHAAEAERPVAAQQHNLAVGVRQLGGQRVAGTRAQAAEGSGVDELAGSGALEEAAGEAHEVAAVADHDGVGVEKGADLGDQPGRVDGC